MDQVYPYGGAPRGYRQRVNRYVGYANRAATLYGAAKRGWNMYKKFNKYTKQYSKKRKGSSEQFVARGNRVRRRSRRVKRRRIKRTLKKRVQKLERTANQLAIHDWRNYGFGQLICAVNECVYVDLDLWYKTKQEAIIDNLAFIDRGATPAVDFINLTQQTYSHDIVFKDIFLSMTVKNNFHIPCEVKIYWFKSKGQHSSSVQALIASNDASLGVSDGETNPLTYPYDFPAVKQQWKLIKTDQSRLNGGDELIGTYTQKYDRYNPQTHDTVNTTYQKDDVIAVIRLVGICGHDVTTDTQVGLAGGKVDYQFHRKAKVSYPSDANFHFIETDIASAGALAAGGEVAGPNVETIKITS